MPRRTRSRSTCGSATCIAGEAVAALGPRLRAPRAITSGYLVSDDPPLDGYRLERRVQVDGWAADLHVRL
jgi:hypothetical protein